MEGSIYAGLEALTDRGLLPQDAGLPAAAESPCPPQVREGVLEYLAQLHVFEWPGSGPPLLW